jgi:threonine aldolase
MEFIDLRSDTVTKPTPEMREAMARAEVGDDVYGEDPTVNKLQDLAAAMTGHEAALFVASGTMGNLTAILAHCQRGDEVILGGSAHTFLYEGGGISELGGVHSCQLPNQPDGSIALEHIRAAIRADDVHMPITKLIALENTHNRCGGTFQSVEYTREVADFAHQLGLKVHLDGARIFNAAVALGIEAKELTGLVDSVTFCLSKGLAAPVGSVLCGSKQFIRAAHRARKLLGGGMRQAGVLAAAGIVAMQQMITRLEQDHSNAQKLADGLGDIAGITLSTDKPATNMVFLRITNELQASAEEVEKELKEHAVLVGISGKRQFRLVTHYGITARDIDQTVSVFREVFANLL